MLHEFYDHRRLVEIAERYDLEIVNDVDTETAIRCLLDQLQHEANILAANIGFVERYLCDTYPSVATNTDEDGEDDDFLSEYEPAADPTDRDVGVTTVVPFDPPTSA